MKLDINDLLQLVESRVDKYNDYIQVSEDQPPFLIFENWESLEGLTAALNGFDGLKGSKPYLRDGETLASKLAEAEAKVLAEPNHFGHKRDKETILSHLLYAQFIETREGELIGLDDFEVESGFSDEYSLCCNCHKHVRTSPDSYSWTPPMFLDSEGYVCDECCEGGSFDAEALEEYKNAQKSIPDTFDLERLGLVKVNKESFEHGLYGGQLDTPEPIIDTFNTNNIDVWFKVYPRQFDLEFDVYVMAEDLERAIELLSNTDVTADRDPAIVLQEQLKSIKI